MVIVILSDVYDDDGDDNSKGEIDDEGDGMEW